LRPPLLAVSTTRQVQQNGDKTPFRIAMRLNAVPTTAEKNASIGAMQLHRRTQWIRRERRPLAGNPLSEGLAEFLDDNGLERPLERDIDEKLPDRTAVRRPVRKRYLQLLLVARPVSEQLVGRDAADERVVKIGWEHVRHNQMRHRIEHELRP